MIQRFSIAFGALTILAVLGVGVNAKSVSSNLHGGSPEKALIAQAGPSYIPWFYASPTPIPGAYAALGAAFGAGNLYNTGGTYAGTAMLNTGACFFVCYGAPGQASHHMLAFGNDINGVSSYTTQGSPDDCGAKCPGGIANSVWSVTVYPTEINMGYYAAIDGNANLGVANNVVAGAGVIAAKGVQPNGSSGAYAAETLPLGASEQHPKIMSGNCVGLTTTTVCTFPNSFAFPDTSYSCTVSALGTSPVSESYTRTSSTSITVYSSAVATFTFICLE